MHDRWQPHNPGSIRPALEHACRWRTSAPANGVGHLLPTKPYVLDGEPLKERGSHYGTFGSANAILE